MLQCSESIYRFVPSPYVQAFAYSRIFGFARTLAPVGPVAVSLIPSVGTPADVSLAVDDLTAIVSPDVP